jgi:Rps23 Pro-64 3,4-dihydroxylase Tpa1-like proline 4-hydroxylase
MNRIDYARADSDRWVKVWSLNDGVVLRSTQWGGKSPDWTLEIMPMPQGRRSPPGPETLVKFFGVLRELLNRHEGLPAIRRIVMAPYVYPAQTSLSWHYDGANPGDMRVGAFTYYAHQEWNAEWGGELFLTDIPERIDMPPFDNSEVSKAIMNKGHGVWISPKPNRLVVNPSDMYHKVSKTSAAAAPRLSIQGFLYET